MSLQELWTKFFLACDLPTNVSKRYAQRFVKERMQPSILNALDEIKLKERGIDTIGDQLAVLRYIKKYDNGIPKEFRTSAEEEEKHLIDEDELIESEPAGKSLALNRDVIYHIKMPPKTKSILERQSILRNKGVIKRATSGVRVSGTDVSRASEPAAKFLAPNRDEIYHIKLIGSQKFFCASHIKYMATENVKLDFWKWSPKPFYYWKRDGDTTFFSKEQTKLRQKKLWPKYLRRIRKIESIEDLRLNLETIKLEHDTSQAVGYNYSVEGLKPCWDKDKRNNAGNMDRIIYADINLASDPKRINALLNKWGRLAESLFYGVDLCADDFALCANVKCITINVRIDRHKIFIWTTKDLSRDVLVEIQDICQDIANRCMPQIELVWGMTDL